MPINYSHPVPNSPSPGFLCCYWKTLPYSLRNRQAKWKENHLLLTGVIIVLVETIPCLELQVRGSNSTSSLLGKLLTQLGRVTQEKTLSQETCLIIYLFSLSLPSGLNIYLLLNASEEEEEERLADAATPQDEFWWHLCWAHGKSSKGVAKSQTWLSNWTQIFQTHHQEPVVAWGCCYQARVFCLRNQKEGTLSETICKPKLDFANTWV